jgi:hypothetical protein
MSASRPHVYSTTTVTNANESAANTETVAGTLTGVTSEFPQQVVQLIGYVVFTCGSGITSMTIRIRQDSLTGALVGTADAHAGDIVASKISGLPIVKSDATRECAAATYVLTIQGAGEGGAAAIGAVALSALVS